MNKFTKKSKSMSIKMFNFINKFQAFSGCLRGARQSIETPEAEHRRTFAPIAREAAAQRLLSGMTRARVQHGQNMRVAKDAVPETGKNLWQLYGILRTGFPNNDLKKLQSDIVAFAEMSDTKLAYENIRKRMVEHPSQSPEYNNLRIHYDAAKPPLYACIDGYRKRVASDAAEAACRRNKIIDSRTD